MSRRVDFEIPDGAPIRACSTCGHSIAWIETKGGKRMPLDVATAQKDLAGSLRAESHFAHCPQADEHRKARG